MAFENLKSTGIKYLLGKLKTVFLQIKDAVKTVNDEEPDEDGNINIVTVPFAQNLESESSQKSNAFFVQRLAGGEASVQSGDAWLLSVKGNSVHNNYVAESIEMTVNAIDRETPITATLNRDTFVSVVQESGTITLVYSNGWTTEPSSYGITVTGTPVDGDIITVVYVAEERGTISVATPESMIATGWNLYNHTNGYARVIKYANGYRVEGTYTSLQYSATVDGIKSEIVVTDGNFDIPDDGFVWVNNGSASDTEIYATWDDWSEGHEEEFEVYTESKIDFSSVMSTYFPYGLLKVGSVVDEIDLNLGQVISRIERMEYSDANMTIARNSGRDFEYDENFIYLVRSSAITSNVSVSGAFSVNDHGIEFFSDTSIAVDAQILYGNNLKNKLERDVLTISPQNLTASQQMQVRTNINAANGTDFNELSSYHLKSGNTVTNLQIEGVVGFVTSSAKSAHIYIPLKLNDNITRVNVSSLKVGLRISTGGYLGGADTFEVSSYIASATIVRRQGLLYIVVTKSDGWGATNNTPFVGRAVITATFLNT